MDIKFGFADTARELVIRVDGEQQELLNRINEAVDNNSTLELADEKGRKYLVRTERVVYVEVGNSTAHAVGFIGK
ncbi:MAG: DUF3107 domain-containing protein [Corynebacterium sp.]|nr:DUF3107 domain-containing protein [Corynebacterium sp.]